MAALPVGTPLSVRGVTSSFGVGRGVLDEVHVSMCMVLREAGADMTSEFDGMPDAAGVRLVEVETESVQLSTSFRVLPSLVVPLRAGVGLADVRQEDIAMRLHSGLFEVGKPVVLFEMVVDSAHPLPASPLSVPDVVAYYQQQTLPRIDGHKSHDSRIAAAAAEFKLNTTLPFAFLSHSPTVHLSGFTLAYARSNRQPISCEVEVRAETALQLRGFHIAQPRLRVPLDRPTYRERESAILGSARATYTTPSSGTLVECCADVTIHNGDSYVGAHPVVMEGDCLSVMRMADILAANTRKDVGDCTSASASSSASSSAAVPLNSAPPPLCSFTALSWTLNSVLAAQLPCLRMSSPPAVPPGMEMKQWMKRNFMRGWNRVSWVERRQQGWNRVSCVYTLKAHSIDRVNCGKLSLSFIDSSSPSSPLLPLTVQLDTHHPRDAHGHRITAVSSPVTQFLLRPLLQFPLNAQTQLTTCAIVPIALMSLAQLLTLISVPSHLVPPALLHRVLFSQVTAVLTMDASTGWPLFLAGVGDCGPSIMDQLLFYNRVVPAASVKGRVSSHVKVSRLFSTPLNRWMRLQSRAVLNPAVFPQLTALTSDRCLQPLYQYVLCEVEGSVEGSERQRAAVEEQYHTTVCGLDPHPEESLIRPLKLRPINAVVALQPHLSSGYLELPFSALALPTPHTPPHTLATSASSPSFTSSTGLSRAPSRLLARLSEHSVELFCLCADYLDTNSLLYGLLPATHSLRSVTTAALAGSRYWRGVLLRRFGVWSDAALWSAELLNEWRANACEREWQEWYEQLDVPCPVGVSYLDPSALVDGLRGMEMSDMATSVSPLAARLVLRVQGDVYWAAVEQLQCRVNTFLVRVMLQKKEDVLPQLFTRSQPSIVSVHTSASAVAPPGTVRPVYLAVSDAMMQALMCVPPYHLVPPNVSGYSLQTFRARPVSWEVQEEQPLLSESSHRADFAAFMRWDQRRDCLWSLYMGPVYAYESDYTAGKGVQVDVSDCDTVSDPMNRAALIAVTRGGRGVRQLYIDDVNQLPVTRRMLSGDEERTRLYAPTLAACFRAKGVFEQIAKVREKWRRIAERHAERTRAHMKAGKRMRKDNEEEDKKADDSEEEGGECERNDQPDNRRMGDREGALLEYVDPLMTALLDRQHDAMWKRWTWTDEVAEMAATALRAGGFDA